MEKQSTNSEAKKKIAAIYIMGLPYIDKPERVGNYEYTDDQELTSFLKEQQKGYCNPGDRIKVRKAIEQIQGKPMTTIEAYSVGDYSYKAIVGMRFKKDPECCCENPHAIPAKLISECCPVHNQVPRECFAETKCAHA